LYPKSYFLNVVISITLIVFCGIGFAPQLCGVELDEVLLKRFQNEAPKAWKKQLEFHKKFYFGTSGLTINSNQKVVREGKAIQVDEYQEKRIRSNYRQMISKDVRKGERTLKCANPRYAFELASSSSREWAVTGIYPYQAAPADEVVNKDSYNRIMESAREIRPQSLPLRGDGKQILWLSEDVKIQDIKSISVKNRECFEVSIDFPFAFFSPIGNTQKFVETVERRLAVGVFDPTNDWVLLSFAWNQTPNLRTSYTASYDENLGGIPFMTRCRQEIRNLATNIVLDDFDYERSASVAELSDRDFTLSAFGFPEPALEQPPPYWLYSSFGGLVLVIIGGFLYKWGVGLRRSWWFIQAKAKYPMLRLKRFIAAALFVIACGLIGSTIFNRSTILEIESSELTLINFPFGEDRNLSFNVRNPSFFGSAQIVGLRGACGLGCVEEVDFHPFQLKAGETKRMTVLFKSPRQPGRIEAAFSLFHTSNNGTRCKELCVRGNAVESENR